MIHGILLAAGRGRRVGRPKALLPFGAFTFHQRAVASFRAASLPAVVVVSAEVQAELPPPSQGEHRVLNDDPDLHGMFGSVRLGVGAVRALGGTGAILLPVDHPAVTAGDIQLLASALAKGAQIVVATHGGRRGHPIGLSATVLDEIDAMAALGDLGTLRDVLHKDPRRVVEVPVSEGAVLGINTREDLDRVLSAGFR